MIAIELRSQAEYFRAGLHRGPVNKTDDKEAHHGNTGGYCRGCGALLEEQAIKDIFGWDEYIHVVSLLPLGYPAEEPAPRKSRTPEEILL